MSQESKKAIQDWYRESSSRLQGKVYFDESLSRHTYYRIGGPAAVLVIPQSIEDLRVIAEGARETGCSCFVMGAGSNLLVSDDGCDQVVIKATRLNLEIQTREEQGVLLVKTGAGVAVSTLLRRAAQEGWGGLEFLTGIPGLIGGVVSMNAGTHLGEACQALAAVEAYDLMSSGELIRFQAENLHFNYRKNLFLPRGGVVYSATFRVEPGEPTEVKSRIDQVLARRKSTQPLDSPSCGSVFKNPRASGLHAWQVIERLGLRGKRIGDAQFSEKHCNFIVNLGKARAADVKALIDLAKQRAKAELGIDLEEEVRYLGTVGPRWLA